jgi:hypothetical protein
MARIGGKGALQQQMGRRDVLKVFLEEFGVEDLRRPVL